MSNETTVKRSDPMYLKEYYRARKAQNPEYYNLHSLRKYYRKQLKSLDDTAASQGRAAESDVERKTKILSKLESLDEQLKNIKESRNKYTRWQRMSDNDSSSEN